MKNRVLRTILLCLGALRHVVGFPPQHRAEAQSGICHRAGFKSCNKEVPGLPDRFCCPRDSNCMALAGNTTAFCCPEKSTCTDVWTRACQLPEPEDIGNDWHTVAYNSSLPVCGDFCCPFGYHCNGLRCRIDEDQDLAPPASLQLSGHEEDHEDSQVETDIQGDKDEPSGDGEMANSTQPTQIHGNVTELLPSTLATDMAVKGGEKEKNLRIGIATLGGAGGLALVGAATWFLLKLKRRKLCAHCKRESNSTTASYGKRTMETKTTLELAPVYPNTYVPQFEAVELPCQEIPRR